MKHHSNEEIFVHRFLPLATPTLLAPTIGPLHQRYEYYRDTAGFFKMEYTGQFFRLLIDFIGDLTIDEGDQFAVGVDALRQPSSGPMYDDILIVGRKLQDDFRVLLMRGAGHEWGDPRIPANWEITTRVGLHDSDTLDVDHVTYEVSIARSFFLGRSGVGMLIEAYDASTDTLARNERGPHGEESCTMRKRNSGSRFRIDNASFMKVYQEKDSVQDEATLDILRFFSSAYHREL